MSPSSQVGTFPFESFKGTILFFPFVITINTLFLYEVLSDIFKLLHCFVVGILVHGNFFLSPCQLTEGSEASSHGLEGSHCYSTEDVVCVYILFNGHKTLSRTTFRATLVVVAQHDCFRKSTLYVIRPGYY